MWGSPPSCGGYRDRLEPVPLNRSWVAALSCTAVTRAARRLILAGRRRSFPRRSVGGHGNLPAGGRQSLPTHGHLVMQGAGGRTRQTGRRRPSTGTLGRCPTSLCVHIRGQAGSLRALGSFRGSPSFRSGGASAGLAVVDCRRCACSVVASPDGPYGVWLWCERSREYG